MAEDGYLPAWIALRLFDIKFANRPRNDEEAVRLLMKARDSGDLSAACMMMPISAALADRVAGYDESTERALAKGAQAGHGKCLSIMGLRLASAHRTVLVPPPGERWRKLDQAIPLLYEGARQGYFLAHHTLFKIRKDEAVARNYRFANALDFERTLCWGRLAQQHSNSADLHGFEWHLVGVARRGLSPERLANTLPEWRGKIPESFYPILDQFSVYKVPITRRVATPERCLALEEEFAKTQNEGNEK
jgi:hypothetical protein